MISIARISRSIKRRWNLIRKRGFLTILKYRARSSPRNQPGQFRFQGLNITYTDLLSLYMEYKDIFGHRIYHFEANTATPYIIDGGGCLGMSVLYFKSIYPEATIVCFEPDRNLFKILQSNLANNGLKNITLIQAGLAGEVGTASFLPDGADAGKLVNAYNGEFMIKTVCLSEYVSAPVDFVKLNIEGQELPVLLEVEARGKLRNIREFVLEYHGWAGGEQRLGAILNVFDRNGFRYLVHDFDRETCGASKPPFQWTPQTTWYCLVYARRIGDD